jgi:hypothetical protein
LCTNMVIHVLETVTKEEERKRKSLALCSQSQLDLAHLTVRWGTGQCSVRWAGPRELAALGIRRRRTTIIHRTVRWCTGLSGETTVASANDRPHDLLATRGPQQRSVGHTRLSGVHRTVPGAPTDPEDQWSNVLDLEGDRAPDSYSDCSVVHRTVRCTTRQKASLAFLVGLQRLLAALGL